jgi:DNA ligase (NAD+)
MNRNEIKKQIEALRESINRYNYLYYVENISEISDYEFDCLMKKLDELEKRYPESILFLISS